MKILLEKFINLQEAKNTNKMEKKKLWKIAGDYENHTPAQREDAIKGYLFLCKKKIELEDFMKLPLYDYKEKHEPIEYRLKYHNQREGYTLTFNENGKSELKGYRFI